MSQNKTVVSGENFNQAESDNSLFNELYCRNPESSNATYVPGVNQKCPSSFSIGEQLDSIEIEEEKEPRTVILKERVIVGILFSISKGVLGNLFPIYLGDNLIGNLEGCDVCLLEKTVSPKHALLKVNRQPEMMGYHVTITDLNSMYGTLVNDIDARYDSLVVSENDVITCGLHYKLLLKIFDVEEAKLYEDCEFEPIQNNQNNIEIPQRSNLSNAFYTPTKNNPNSSKTVLY